MQQQQDNDNGDADEKDEKKATNPIIDQTFKEYVLYPANALKKELKKAGLYTKGKKPDLARRLAEYEYRLDHPDAPAYYTNAEIGNKVKKGENRKKKGKTDADADDSDLPTRKPSTYLEPKEKKNETKKKKKPLKL
mmetsp:Transcript_29109/g.32652  ORF Transcript_29109/g.32652 Transcript_29109/m.32652 type:complete len:136 (-) Transcript_29109:5-412(-)